MAGHTNRVYTMLHVFDECSAGRYERNSMTTDDPHHHSHHHEHGTTTMKKRIAPGTKTGSFNQLTNRSLKNDLVFLE